MVLQFIFKLFSILLAITLVILTYLKWAHQYWKRRNIPFLKPHPLFGNFRNFKSRTTSIGIYMREIYNEIKSNDLKYCGIYFIARPIFLACDLELLRNITTKDFHYFTDRGMYYNERDDPISAHLFAIGGNKWKQLRAKLTPTFTSGKMKMMFPTMVECVHLMVDKLLMDFRENESIDIKEATGRYTTDIIGSCAFGLDCNTIKDENSPFRIYGRSVFSSTKFRILQMIFSTNFPNIARSLHIRQIPKEISTFFTKIVKDTVKYRETNQIQRKDFLQLLIELREKEESSEEGLTINEIVAQSFVFFLAGFETSSTTMAFALYELSKNNHLQERLRDEIKTVLNHHGNEISYEAINEMKFMSQIFSETLRKYPPLPYVSRICVQDYPVPNENVVIEKGTRVIIPILGIHHDPAYYPNPEDFDPERFNEENRPLRHQCCHIPFGEGPRNCIGMRFGLLQSKVALAALLQKFKFKVSPKTKEPLTMSPNSFVLTAEGGIWLEAEKI